MGNYGCDAPLSLVQSALDHAAKITGVEDGSSSGSSSSNGGGPAFVIVTFNIVRHSDDEIFSVRDRRVEGQQQNEGVVVVLDQGSG